MEPIRKAKILHTNILSKGFEEIEEFLKENNRILVDVNISIISENYYVIVIVYEEYEDWDLSKVQQEIMDDLL